MICWLSKLKLAKELSTFHNLISSSRPNGLNQTYPWNILMPIELKRFFQMKDPIFIIMVHRSLYRVKMKCDWLIFLWLKGQPDRTLYGVFLRWWSWESRSKRLILIRLNIPAFRLSDKARWLCNSKNGGSRVTSVHIYKDQGLMQLCV